MAKIAAALLLFFLGFAMVACGKAGPGEAVLLLYARASAVYREGRYADAASMLADVERFPPALVLRGKALFLAGDDDNAEKTLRRALARNPGNVEAGLFLARLLREKNNYKEAEGIVEKVLGNDPLNISALRLAAELALDADPHGEARAIAFLDRAAESSTEAALVFLDRARIRWIGGSAASALEDIARAKALLPQNSPVTRSIVNLEKTIIGAGAGL